MFTAVDFKIGLPYLKRKNSWQSQWLLFTTTNKCHTAFFSMFLQLPITTAKQHPSDYSSKIIVDAGSS